MDNHTTASIKGKECSKNNPCPICNKTDWCLITGNLSAVICGRVNIGSQPTGWYWTGKNSKDGRPIYRLESYVNRRETNFLRNDKQSKGEKTMSLSTSHVNSSTTKDNQSIKLSKANSNYLLGKVIKPDLLIQVLRFAGSKRFIELNSKVTEYTYSVNQKVYRVDKQDGKKEFYPVAQTMEGVKVAQLETTGLYPMNFITNGNLECEWVAMVEGEKCTDFSIKELGIKAFTVHNWNEDVIRGTLNAIRDAKVSGIVIIPDNDETGLKKASNIERICDEINLKCISLPLNPIAEELGISRWA